MQEQKSVDDWRGEVSDTNKATLKVLDGEKVTFVFLDEGKKKSHPDYGDSIAFDIDHGKERKVFYVKNTNFDLLRQIKLLGKLTGLTADLSRTGSKKSDTRYKIEKHK